MDRQSQILGHLPVDVNGFDTGAFEVQREGEQPVVAIELGAVGQAAGPSEYRRDGVGRCLITLLVLAVVARHGAYESGRREAG
ncbi:hypothetical protein BC936DRAFT_139211 [Jimgerdemannia flammicorona]|uniref:Uncharacterized protein n=1 Tax=Jimgerdemannia flammicorona TaxID=994334 RepID=A0A433BAF2_9FUNG|nr:hypothetical protein BC936DRAFT_139211 [Jimgerdemannia flammicorona]